MEYPPQYYEFPTENPHVVEELASSIHPQPSVVATPIGGEPWPILFQHIFPQAKVISFDNNPAQIKAYGKAIHDVTRQNPLLLDVTSDSFHALLQKLDPETLKDKSATTLLNLSNIPDYLSPRQALELIEIISELGIPYIMFSGSDPALIRNSPGIHGNMRYTTDDFAESLEDEGYTVTRNFGQLKTGISYGVTNNFLARINDDDLEEDDLLD